MDSKHFLTATKDTLPIRAMNRTDRQKKIGKPLTHYLREAVLQLVLIHAVVVVVSVDDGTRSAVSSSRDEMAAGVTASRSSSSRERPESAAVRF